ncbi:MAG: RDD family protein [Myxococcales bacterium]|nr:RDD family protein [Myxococcales bacterium]
MPATQEPATGERYRVAGFWRRAVATGVDGLVLLPVLLLATSAIAAVGGHPLPRAGELGLGYVVNLALNGGAVGPAALGMDALVIGLYSFIFHALRGQTPGKRLLRLRVIDPFGVRPSPGRALLRTAGSLLSLLGCSLGFLWVGFDREKRGLHDWLAGTYVVREVGRRPAPVLGAAGPTPARATVADQAPVSSMMPP